MYNDPTIGVISDDDQRDIINRCKSKRLLFDVDAHINFCYWDTKDDACKSSTNEESQISSHCKKFGSDIIDNTYSNLPDGATPDNTTVQVQTYSGANNKQIMALNPSDTDLPNAYGYCKPPSLSDDCVEYMNNELFNNGDTMYLTEFREKCLDVYKEDKCGNESCAVYIPHSSDDTWPWK